MTAARALIVFDLDGTLVDSSRDLADAVNAALRRIDPSAPTLALEVVRSFIGSGARNLVARSLVHAGVALPPEEALPVFLEEYERRLTGHTRFYPGVEDVLDRLAEHPLAVLTNKPGDMSRRILDSLGAGARFFRVYGGGDLPSRKPDPDGLLRLMAESMAAPRTTVMVGDSGDRRADGARGGRVDGRRPLRFRPRKPRIRASGRAFRPPPGAPRVHGIASDDCATLKALHGQHSRLGQGPRHHLRRPPGGDHDGGGRRPRRPAGRPGGQGQHARPRRCRASRIGARRPRSVGALGR